jgi:hypothetical protein
MLTPCRILLQPFRRALRHGIDTVTDPPTPVSARIILRSDKFP